MSAEPEVLAAIYGRQSHGKKASIEQQIDTARALCVEQGWATGPTYQDGVLRELAASAA